MTYFTTEVVTRLPHLPVEVAAADQALAAAVTEEVERASCGAPSCCRLGRS